VLADDHAPTRAGVRETLSQAGFTVCAEAADADGAIVAAMAERPDLCLLDIHMPGDGIRAAGEIHERCPATTIVMLTVSQDDADLFAALRAGAVGYLLKGTDPSRLPLALRGVMDGEAALPRSLVARLVDEFRTRGRRTRLSLKRTRGEELTRREWDVLDLLLDGLTTKEIADRLSVAPVTVRTHVSAVLRKLDAADREEIVRLFGER
jgi:DNA-binding NarL/FixJ family response regulator